MQILKFPHPSLFTPCKEVKVFTPELKILLESMWETMNANGGLGLAANQVGLEYRIVTMKGPENEKIFLVNPEIVECSINTSLLSEGCLSAPGQVISLPRLVWVKVNFKNELGEDQVRTFTDIYSVCVQHEIEHLNGKSFLQNKAISRKLRIFLAKKWGLK